MNATATKTPEIYSTPAGEARCAHRSCWGYVCPACFEAAPFLQDVCGQVFTMTGAEWLEGETQGVKISPATPEVQVLDAYQVRPGDLLLGYTSNAAKALLVVAIEHGTIVTNRGRITDTKVAVVRRTAA